MWFFDITIALVMSVCCMQKSGCDIWSQIIETQAAKHAVSIARTSSADIIACVSGDGIVHEVCCSDLKAFLGLNQNHFIVI